MFLGKDTYPLVHRRGISIVPKKRVRQDHTVSLGLVPHYLGLSSKKRGCMMLRLSLLISFIILLSIKISRPECSVNLGGLGPHLARGDPSRRDRERIPAGVFARQPMDPWKDSTLSNCTASPGQDDGPQDQKPLGDSAPFPAAGVPFPACGLRRSRCAVPEQSARSQAPGEEDAPAPGSVELSRRIPKSDSKMEKTARAERIGLSIQPYPVYAASYTG